MTVGRFFVYAASAVKQIKLHPQSPDEAELLFFLKITLFITLLDEYLIPQSNIKYLIEIKFSGSLIKYRFSLFTNNPSFISFTIDNTFN